MSPGLTRCSEPTIATMSWLAAVTWSSSSLPRYSTTSARPGNVADVAPGLAELEVLGPEPGDELAAGGARPPRVASGGSGIDQSPGADELGVAARPSMVTSTKFIDGLPMNPATNRLAGWS